MLFPTRAFQLNWVDWCKTCELRGLISHCTMPVRRLHFVSRWRTDEPPIFFFFLTWLNCSRCNSVQKSSYTLCNIKLISCRLFLFFQCLLYDFDILLFPHHDNYVTSFKNKQFYFNLTAKNLISYTTVLLIHLSQHHQFQSIFLSSTKKKEKRSSCSRSHPRNTVLSEITGQTQAGSREASVSTKRQLIRHYCSCAKYGRWLVKVHLVDYPMAIADYAWRFSCQVAVSGATSFVVACCTKLHFEKLHRSILIARRSSLNLFSVAPLTSYSIHIHTHARTHMHVKRARDN